MNKSKKLHIESYDFFTLKEMLKDGMVDYERCIENDTNSEHTASIIIEALAFYWCYQYDFNKNFSEFRNRYINFIKNSPNLESLKNELNLAAINKIKQDIFFYSTERNYKIKKDEVNKFEEIVELESTTPISEYRVSYPAGIFKNQEIYEQYEQQTIENLGKILEILGPNWSFYLRIRSGPIDFNGRFFGYGPVAEITSVRETSGLIDDTEDLPAGIVLPVSTDCFCQVIEACATNPNQTEPTDLHMLIKRMIDSHSLSEELHKTLATQDIHQPVAKRASAKI